MIEEVKPKNDYPIGHPKFWEDISIEALVKGDKDYSQWQDRDAMWLSRKRRCKPDKIQERCFGSDNKMK